MIVSTITQLGYDLSCDINDIPAQFSGDIEFRFVKDSKYENYVVVPYYKYLNNRFLENNRDSKTYQLIINNNIFKLPPQAFELDGYLAIAFSLSNGNETIQTNPIIYKIKATAGKGNILPEENTWQNMVIKVANDYIDINVKDVVNEMLSTSNEHQNEVNRLIERASTQQDEITSVIADSRSATSATRSATILATQGAKSAQDASNDAKTATTNANQASQRANDAANSVVIIRNGTTTPASSLGKSGDFYVNTTNGDFYLKNSTTWNKKFNMVALDQITELKNAFNSVTSLTKQLFLLMHPVGCIYMSTSSVSPQTTFGGTWIRWGNGRVPVGVNTSDSDFNTVEKTGGEKKHTLTINEMPAHSHEDAKARGLQNTATGSAKYGFIMDGSYSSTAYTGGNESHNNLQPYITCYMWKRTA
ncbi:phage baseplate protein [Thomasclavelia cocleata]|uniref:phage baseplate protein n=1 Tax=Thomasclavelia cocleata TaxID=69824 RepID=UPI00242B15AE|nr:hypothetical protein [Thomasclavelia cocleata]